MTARAWPLATLIFGIATLAAFVAMGAHPAVQAVYERTEVSAFQRAETLNDIVIVFGAPVDERVIAAQNAINTIDLYAFIPAYALFLAAAAIMLGGLRNPWAQAAVFFALTGAIMDVAETWKQLRITADLSNAEAHLPLAPWHWLKYLALALNGAAVASIALSGEQRRWIIAVIGLLPLPLVAGAYMELLPTRAFSAAFALYWIALLALSIVELLRKRSV